MGVEERVGVSFIRAEATTEERVVLMDSSSKSSMSKESTRETSYVTSATVLKDVRTLGSTNPSQILSHQDPCSYWAERHRVHYSTKNHTHPR